MDMRCNNNILQRQEMGGQESNSMNNQRFNPNFNMAEYNQRLNSMRTQYNHQNIEAPGAYYSQRTSAQTMNCQQITRNVYIFKTTIQLHVDNNRQLIVQFQYHSSRECTFDIALGVKRIQQDQVSKQTLHVDCMKSFRETLAPNQKGKYTKHYHLNQGELNALFSYGVLMKLSSQAEASEYSLNYNKNTKLWKVMVENFRRGNQTFGIQDIYGGGDEGQQCIICFTQKSTTMVQPCNHLCLCKDCAKVVQNQSNNCPICRKKIMSLVTLRKAG